MPSHQRYCCICKNYGGKVVDGKKVSMHRFPADLRVRKVWIQRCKNTRPNFVFVNSDQTRMCAVHFIGRCGPTKGNPLPCFFPKAEGGEKVYKLSTMESVADIDLVTSTEENNDTSEMELTTDNRSPDMSFENDADGIPVEGNESILDISLRAEMKSASGSVVVISFGLQEGAEKWLKDTQCPFPMLLDSDRKIYHTFGLQRSVLKVWGVASLVYYAEAMYAGKPLPKPYENVHDDTQQMGGDFIIDGTGVVRFMYPSKTNTDRPSVDLLMDELKKINSV